MPNLVFYTNPRSRGRVVRWMLEEIGEPYETVVLDYGTTMKGRDYLAINPMGKVPALRHGDTIITEAAAICTYLADAFPEKGLAPAIGDTRRGTYFRWLYFAAGCVEAAVTDKALKAAVSDEQKAFVGYGSLDETINALELAISPGPFICGEQFTTADLYVGSQIGWGMMFGTIEQRPAFVEYIGRLQTRPAFRRAVELDEALVNPRPEPEARTA